jgi:hypothetical protein
VHGLETHGVNPGLSRRDFRYCVTVIAHPLQLAFGEHTLGGHFDQLVFERSGPQIGDQDVHFAPAPI